MPADDLVYQTYILKVASRCNLRCAYCYMYFLEGGDDWKSQPHFMSDLTLETTIRKACEHLREHGKESADFVIHGGEPLLAGSERLDRWFHLMRSVSEEHGIRLHIGIQSNGLLFTPQIGDVLIKHGVFIGVSIDGIPGKGDLFRVNEHGIPSGLQVQEKLLLLADKPYESVFSGFLSVINLDNDPIETFEYLARFKPRIVDFLLPLGNHVRPPKGKEGNTLSVPYAEWLGKIFDHILDNKVELPLVRILSAIGLILAGEKEGRLALGQEEFLVAVIESNGDVEFADSYKAAAYGLGNLGMSVHRNSFDEAARILSGKVAQLGLQRLHEKCVNCTLGKHCGGGNPPHRYNVDGFVNPSVYCEDLKLLFHHVHERLLDATQAIPLASPIA